MSEERRLSETDELMIRTDYEARRQFFQALGNNIRLICEAALEKGDIPYHSVKVRIKSILSTLEKILRKGYKPSLEQVEDLVGIRVILLYHKHVDPVVDLLSKEFKVIERVDRRPEPDPQKFGYSSVHLICALQGTQRAPLPEYATLTSARFEIQVRTILQEAWAEIEHQLVYKGEGSAPDDIRRQITRVSALLEVADKEFQEVYDRRIHYTQRLKQADISVLRDEPLNVDSLVELIRRRYPWAEGWNAIEPKQETEKDMNRLALQCRAVSVKTIRQLVSILDKWDQEVREENGRRYEAEIASKRAPKQGTMTRRSYEWSRSRKSYYVPSGFIRVSLGREFPNFDELLVGEEEDLEEDSS